MLNRFVLKAASIFAPSWAERHGKRHWYVQRATTFRNDLSSLTGWDAKIVHAQTFDDFAASQKLAEIRELLERISQLKAKRVLEIGSFQGGTLGLFAQAAAHDAQILSLDLNFTDHRLHSFPKLALPGQIITCHKADSHSQETLKYVVHWLDSELLDVLFIDGDHSYDGVKADYEMYAPLVRPGGLIAFHDVHPDFKTRYGTVTEADVGEVPRFWNELRAQGYVVHECIEHDSQDGMGIGFLIRQRA